MYFVIIVGEVQRLQLITEIWPFVTIEDAIELILDGAGRRTAISACGVAVVAFFIQVV